VVLFERSEDLGGHLREAGIPEFKSDMKRLLEWYLVQMEKPGIEIRLRTEVALETISAERPDVVIVATGSSPLEYRRPSIEGGPRFIDAVDLLRGRQKAGDSIVVLGGGEVGCEIALWLVKQHKPVTIVEKDTVMSEGVFEANRSMLLDLLAEAGVRILTESTIEETSRAGIIVSRNDSTREKVNCDTVILALGRRPESSLYESLKDQVAELHAIGDCNEPRKIINAIWEARDTAYAV
jgi:2-enoate reductase